MRFNTLNSVARNIAVCVAIFVAARYVVAPHMKHEHATGVPTSTVQQAAAIKVANEYMKAHNSNFDLNAHTVVSIEKSDSVEVRYDKSADAANTSVRVSIAPIIIIDKATMTVRSATF